MDPKRAQQIIEKLQERIDALKTQEGTDVQDRIVFLEAAKKKLESYLPQ